MGKDSWEDEENEKNQVASSAAAPPAKKKANKRLEEKIAEKERKAKEEAEQKRILQQENMTPEEKLADKLYRQKLVEESDFEMARETFGLSSKGSNREGSIDDAFPSTKGKTKLVLKMDRETDNYGDDFGGGDYDDFM